MAEILLAERLGVEGFAQLVVLKRLLPHLAGNPEFVDTLIDEARIAARVHHKNVVRVFDLERKKGELYLVMEYVEGKTLLEILRYGSHIIDYGLAAHVIAEACEGLHAAHEKGIVHRDVSPSNIMVSTSGEVRVFDFGIATSVDRFTETRNGILKGKYAYLAPERIEGRPVDRRADVYCLGIVLFELTLRRRLFKRSNEVASLNAIVQHKVPRPSQVAAGYPPELERIVMKALAHDPADRYATALEMGRDLRRLRYVSDAPQLELIRIVDGVSKGLEPDEEPTDSAISRPIELLGEEENVPTRCVESVVRSMVGVRPRRSPRRNPTTQQIIRPRRTRFVAAAGLMVAALIFGSTLIAAQKDAPIVVEYRPPQTIEPVVIEAPEPAPPPVAVPRAEPKVVARVVAKPVARRRAIPKRRPHVAPKVAVAKPEPEPEPEFKYERFH